MSRAGVRSAVGASVLSTMLLIGGPTAVALADTDSGGGTSGSTGTSGSSESSGTTGGTAKSGSDVGAGLRASLRQSLTNVRSVIGPWTAQRPQAGFGGRPRTTLPTLPDSSSTPTEFELTAPETVVTDPEVAAPEQQPVTQPAATPLANNSGTPKPAKPAGPPPARPVSVKAPLTYDKLPDVAHTVGNTVASVLDSTQQTVFAVPALLAALPGSTTPVSDVISTLEFMLTSVSTSVGTIAALPGELGALMGVSTPPVAPIGMEPEARPATALAGPIDLPGLLMPQTPAIALGAGVTAPAPAAPALSPAAPIDVERTAPTTTAPLGVSGLTASGAPESFLDRAVSTLLVPISIATLAAVALPGVGGLLVICALGIRIGYRQAKAGWAIRVAGIARFAGSGPMGVVRSGSMITLHTRSPAAAARKAGRLRLVDSSLEQAA